MVTKRKTVKAPTRKASSKRKPAKASAKKASAPPKTGKAQPIVLDSILDLRAAAPLADEFKARRGADIQIDASNVERLGAQCVQVLMSAEKTWTSEGFKLLIVNGSPEFNEGLGVLGVTFCETQMNEANACH